MTIKTQLDLSSWKLTLPVDTAGTITGTAVEIKSDLNKYTNPDFFFKAADGGLVFRAMTEGATTSGSKYARSELREMNGTDRAAWKLNEGGTMTATLKVNEVPTRLDGSQGKMVIGQIHGASEELVRLYYEKGTVYFVNDQAGASNKETKFELKDSSGKTPSISIGEVFSYKIDAHGSTLKIEVYADGKTYSSTTAINSIWQSDSFYFKAGVYLGINETTGTGSGEAEFYGIDFSHTAGQGLDGIVDMTVGEAAAIVPDHVETPAVVTAAATVTDTAAIATSATIEAAKISTSASISKTITGTSGNDTITGGSGDDTLSGKSGKDTISGGDGNDKINGDNDSDTLSGGRGNDTIYGGSGRDTIYGDEGDDKLRGGTDSDMIYGGTGNDKLYGDLGNDTLNGGAGSDKLYGGGGRDTFVIDTMDGTRDDIYDFSAKGSDSDKLDISKILSGYDAHDAIANFVRFSVSGSDTKVLVNADGMGSDFQTVALIHNAKLTASVQNYIDSGVLIAD